MRNFFKNNTGDKVLFRLSLISVLLITLSAILIAFKYRSLPPLLPVFNQLPWGEKRLSATPGIFIPLVVVLVIFLVNVVAVNLSYSRSPLIARMLAVTSFLTSLLTFLFILRTVQLIA